MQYVKKCLPGILPGLLLLLSLHTPLDAQTSDDLLAALEAGVTQVAGSGQFSATSQQMDGNSLSGTGTFLGVDNVQFKATYNGSRLIKYTMTMPESTKISDQLIGSLTQGADQPLFLPDLLRQERLMDSFSADFNPDKSTANLYLSFGIINEIPLVDDVDFSISDIKIDIKIKDPTGDKVPSGGLSGTVNLKNNRLTLTSTLTTDPSKWELSASINHFNLNDVFQLFNLGDINLPPVIGEKIGVGETSLTFKPVQANYLKFKSDLNEGMSLEVVLQKGSKQVTSAKPPTLSTMTTGSYNSSSTGTLSTMATGGYNSSATANQSAPSTSTPTPVDSITTTTSKWMALVGVSLSDDFKFKDLNKNLEIIDQMPITNIGLVFSTLDGLNTTSSLSIFKEIGSGSANVRKGLNIIMGLNLHKYKLSDKLGTLADVLLVDNLVVRGYLASDFSSVGIESFINFHENLNLFERIYFENLGLEASITGVEPEFGISGAIMVRPDDHNELLFKGKISLQPASASPTGSIEGALAGTWREPFGLKGLSLDNISIGAGITFPGWQSVMVDNLVLSGGLAMGSLRGESTIYVDVNMPQKSGFQARIERINWSNLVDAFCYGELNTKVKQLTYVMDELDSSLDTAEIYIVPTPITTLAGKSLSTGFKVEARGRIAGLNGDFLVHLDGSLNNFNGFIAQGSMDPIAPISIDGTTLFSLTGAEGEGRPAFTIDLSPGKLLSALAGGDRENKIVYCTAGITILDISEANALIDLNTNGYLLKVNGKVMDIVQGSLEAEIEEFSDPVKNTHVNFTADATGLNEIREKVIEKAANELMKTFGIKNSFRRKVKEQLANTFSINSITFAGQLSGAKTGYKANINFQIAGSSQEIDVSIKPAKAGEFVEDIFQLIKKELKQNAALILNGLTEVAEEVVELGTQAGEKTLEELENTAQALENEFETLDQEMQKAGETLVTTGDKAIEEAQENLDQIGGDIEDLGDDISEGAEREFSKVKKESEKNLKIVVRDLRNVGGFFANGAEFVGDLAGDAFKWATGFANDITKNIENIFDQNDRKRIKSEVPPVWIVHRETGNYLYCVDCTEGKTDIKVRAQTESEAEEWQILPSNEKGYMYIVSKADGRNIHMRGDKVANAEILLRKHATEDKFKEKISLMPAGNDGRYFYFRYKKWNYYIAVNSAGKLYPTLDQNKAAQFEILIPGDLQMEAGKVAREAEAAAKLAAEAYRQSRQAEMDALTQQKQLYEAEKRAAEAARQEKLKALEEATRAAQAAKEKADLARAEADAQARALRRQKQAEGPPSSMGNPGQLYLPDSKGQTAVILSSANNSGVVLRHPPSGSNLQWRKDGNLVLIRKGQEVWQSDTKGRGNQLIWKSDGDLAILQDGELIWHTDTEGGHFLQFIQNGRLAIRSKQGKILWLTEARQLTAANNQQPTEIEKGWLPVPDQPNWAYPGLGKTDHGTILRNGSYTLEWSYDGLSLQGAGKPLWNWNWFTTSRMDYRQNLFLTWQEDGRLVIKEENNNEIIWDSGAPGGAKLRLEPDGRVLILDQSGKTIWERSADYRPSQISERFFYDGRFQRSLNQRETTTILHQGNYQLVWEQGNLKVTNQDRTIWESGTTGKGDELGFDNGHLHIRTYRTEGDLWSTATSEGARLNGDPILRLGEDGMLQLLNQRYREEAPTPVWNNGQTDIPQTATGGLPVPGQPWRKVLSLTAENAGTLLRNGSYHLDWQNGNLWIFKDKEPVWKALAEESGEALTLEYGHLAIVQKRETLWSTQSDDFFGAGPDDIQLVLQADGTLLLKASGQKEFWNSGLSSRFPASLKNGQIPIAGQPWRFNSDLADRGIRAADQHGTLLQNGNFELQWRPDGNLVILQGNDLVWESGTSGTDNTLHWTNNGQLFISGPRRDILWEADITGENQWRNGDMLSLRNDGKLLILANQEVLWESGKEVNGKEEASEDLGGNAGPSVPGKELGLFEEKIPAAQAQILLKNGQYELHWRSGDLILLENDNEIWRASRQDCEECQLYWEEGNLIISDGNYPRWESRVRYGGRRQLENYRLVLEEWGRLSIQDGDGREVWEN